MKFQYRLNWMTALTGWNTYITQYAISETGNLKLFVKLIKCGKVPCTIVTNGQKGGPLPEHTDLTVFGAVGLSCNQTLDNLTFKVYDPIKRIYYFPNAWTILQQLDFVVSPCDGELPLYHDLVTGLSTAPGPSNVSDISKLLTS